MVGGELLPRVNLGRLEGEADPLLVEVHVEDLRDDGDGEAAAFEGWALVALYVILATLTLYE